MRGKTKKIIKTFEVKFRRYSGPGIGDAYLHRVGLRQLLTPPLAYSHRLTRGSSVPHMRLGVQPNCSALRSELKRVFQKVRNHALKFRRIERENRQVIVGQKIKGQTALLEAVRPEFADFGKAIIDLSRP